MKTKGFTLIELLCILLLFGILHRLASSGLESLLRQQKILTAASELLETFQFVRTKAIMQNEWIGICGSANQQQCTSDWSQGYIVFKGRLDCLNEPIPIDQILHVTQHKTKTTIFADEHIAFVFTGEGSCLNRGTLKIGQKKSTLTRQLVVFDSGRMKLLAPTRERAV